MKIVTPQQMASMETEAYRQGCSEEIFMENAGKGVAAFAFEYIRKNSLDKIVTIICGKGNNAGDGYVAGIDLLEAGFQVVAIKADSIEACSPLCQRFQQKFVSSGGLVIDYVQGNEVSFPSSGIILDALFGTGFHGKLEEPYSSLVQSANESSLPILSVDIPSGLNGATGVVEGLAINAVTTIFLGLPKLGFFLEAGWNHVGLLSPVDFGLPKKIIDKQQIDLKLLTEDSMRLLMPKIKRSRHKYQAGLVVGLAGSAEMPGAALLSSLSVLRGGAGMMRLLHPKGIEAQLSHSPYEIIKLGYDQNNAHSIVEQMDLASAIFIGPGMGRTPEVHCLLRQVLPKLTKPCVIDADALFFLSQEEISLPSQSVLTPHIGEMQRLLNMKEHPHLTLDFLKLCQKYVDQRKVTLVLKGGPSFILHPGVPISVNPTGDPGMATAGSGDVLTGLIAALLAQGLAPLPAAQLGVYLHGLAGEYAAKTHTSYAMIASDIIHAFPQAFKIVA